MTGSKVFVDTPIIIYLIEKHPTYYDKVLASVIDLIKSDAKLHTSVLTVAEFEVKPRQLRRYDVAQKNLSLMQWLFHLVEINWHVAQLSAILRAKYSSLRAIDSLQVASAISKRCESFLTNDHRLRIIEEIKIQLI